MRRLYLLVFALLAGCSYYSDKTQEEAQAHTTQGLRAGSGVIDSVGVLPRGRKDAAAATGASGGRRPDPNAYRIFIRMDSGGFQTVDTDNPGFMAGQSIEISPNGRIEHISGSTFALPR